MLFHASVASCFQSVLFVRRLVVFKCLRGLLLGSLLDLSNAIAALRRALVLMLVNLLSTSRLSLGVVLS